MVEALRDAEGLDVVRRFGDRNSEANQLDELGTALLCLGRADEAVECRRQAVEVMADFDESRCVVMRTWIADLEAWSDVPTSGGAG